MSISSSTQMKSQRGADSLAFQMLLPFMVGRNQASYRYFCLPSSHLQIMWVTTLLYHSIQLLKTSI